jgi:uncharacterized protein YbbC (DUF1343 family)
MFIIKYTFISLFIIFTNFLDAQILNGASQVKKYLPLIQVKKVALVVNHTSLINQTHLVDSLMSLGIQVTCIFAPEHGFRGDKSAGTHVNSDIDTKTGIKIISLYGSHKKPTNEDMQNVEYVIFDIQDVGVRFYTYISTMHYVMEICAELNIPLIVLDRPNPNGHYVDGPVLQKEFQSFVGMHPIPLVHGCTVGELALMINGEKWLNGGLNCPLEVVKVANYTHQTPYQLPIKPSPNLMSQSAIYLYPSLGLFEGTVVSIGQGTNKAYQCFGSPDLGFGNYKFVPKSIKGVAENPKFLNDTCIGFDMTLYGEKRHFEQNELNLNPLIMSYRHSQNPLNFFNKNGFFDKLAGTNKLRNQIIEGKSVYEIRQSWQQELNSYKEIRAKYLLYPQN